MRKNIVLLTGIAGLFLLAFVTPTMAADEGKKVTITGTGKCAKCALHETKSCQNAITVDENGKKVTYYLTHNKVSKDFHEHICKTTAKVKATGTVNEPAYAALENFPDPRRPTQADRVALSRSCGNARR